MKHAWSLAGTLLLAALGSPGCGHLGFDADAPDARPFDASLVPVPMPDATPDVDPVESGPADALADVNAPDDALADAATACVVSAVVDYCSTLPPLLAAPVLDGVLDCGPALVPMPAVDWSGPPPLPPFPPGNSTELAVAWRPDGLYVFIDVTTPAAFPADMASPVFYGAGVELFVDDDAVYASPPTYDSPGAIQFVVAAPVDAVTTNHRAEGFRNATDEGPWAATQFGAFATARGFAVEGFVVAADLGLSTWSLAAGKKIGFDVSTDVSYATSSMTGAQGHRVGQYFLRVGTPVGDASTITTPFQDPRTFCTPVLAPM